MTYETILYEVAEGVAAITLNRPDSLNAFNDQMIAEMRDGLKRCRQSQDVRCVLLTGSGRAFSAGQDLKAVSSRSTDFSIGEHLRKGYNRLILALTELEKPVVAAVNGVAAGAGCSVCLAADIRIASHRASFIQAFSKVGLIPDSGSTWLLTRLVGHGRAYEMAAMADPITADTALDWGLVNQVVPHDQLPEISAAWARRLAEGPTLALGLMKRALYRSATSSLADALLYESHLQEVAGRSEDFQRGLQAFLKKEEPDFKGR